MFRYADEISGPGREVLDTLRDRPVAEPLRVTACVGELEQQKQMAVQQARLQLWRW